MSNIPYDDIDITLGSSRPVEWIAFFVQEDPARPPREMSVEEWRLYLNIRWMPWSTIRLWENFWACASEEQANKYRKNIADFLRRPVGDSTDNILSR
jgi:hypothetical protein